MPSHLALNNRRARIDITRRNRPVQLEQQPRIRRLICARERDQAPRVEGAAATGNRELCARDVELGAADASGRVQGDVLDAEEVFAVCDAGGDLYADLGFPWGGEGG